MLEVLAAIFAGNVLSVLCAALLLLASEEKQARLMPWLLNFATGTLLCAGFAGMACPPRWPERRRRRRQAECRSSHARDVTFVTQGSRGLPVG